MGIMAQEMGIMAQEMGIMAQEIGMGKPDSWGLGTMM